MDASSRTEKQGTSHLPINEKLMESGLICPSIYAASIEVRRGMCIRSGEGLEAGKVAAVVLSGDPPIATHILLSRLPEMKGYWLVPVGLVVGVRDGCVELHIPNRVIETLPRWHPA